MRGVRVVLTVLLGIVALLGAGCTSIPEQTRPNVVEQVADSGDQFEVPAPESGLSAIQVVRKFISASGKPVNNHQYARVYLTKQARQEWPSSDSIMIIKQQFSAVRELGEQSEAENRRTVVVTGRIVGSLSPDNAFIPSNSDEPLRVEVTVVHRPNGWRIADPPNQIIMTKSAFTENYLRVPLYFVAPSSGMLVPDLRYVPGKPSEDVPSKVVNLLLEGPSEALTGAVENPLGEKVALEGNVRTAPDGVLEVPLTNVQGKSRNERELMLAQLVLSLQDVTYGGIRALADGDPLVPGGEQVWRASELPAYGAASALSSQLSGLFVLNGRVFSLGDGDPIAGPAGSGVYRIRKAGQSISGDRLAVVEEFEGGVRLRVGPTHGSLGIVDLTGETMTAPTWHPSGSAVWTVVNGTKVVRVQRLSDGTWAPQAVKASALTEMGRITALRLSRDGTRVAAVVDGNVVVASVVRKGNSVSLRGPRVLQPDDLTKAVDVAWYNQHTVVVGTSSGVTPVVRLPIDGLTMSSYNSANLVATIQAVAAAPGRPVIAASERGMSTVESLNAIWRAHKYSSPGAIPFYPG